MTTCAPKNHAGPLTLRRRDSTRCRRQCGTCLLGVGPVVALAKLPVGVRPPPWQRKPPKRSPGRRKREQIAYYRSPEWRALSRACLERDGRICRICGEEANQAYHLDPNKLLDTTLEDLVASCGPCNGDERQRRIARAVLGPEFRRPAKGGTR